MMTVAVEGYAQSQPQTQLTLHSESAKGEVILIDLFRPFYPPVARFANITGDVELKLSVGKDGRIKSAIAESGHPLLQQVALDSVRRSRFVCRGCEQELTSYALVYSFQLRARPGWPCPEEGGLHISQTDRHHVVVEAEPALVNPYFSSVAARKPKCLYLWRCGRQWGGEDYYFYRARSLKCLDLWNCGHELREPFATCKRLHRAIIY
jgi:hypothetical protein